MKVDLYSKTGVKKDTKVDLPDYIFSYPVNEALVRQAVRVYTMNQAQTNAHTKGRSDVRGGGKKPWANNKISRARTSSLRNPIFKGGGVVFGPLSSKNMKRKMSKKMRRAAIFSALSLRTLNNAVYVFEGFDEKEVYKTKDLKKIFAKLSVDGKILFVLGKNDRALVKTVNGIQGVDPILASTLNVYDLLNHDIILVTKAGVESMQNIWKKDGETKLQKEQVKKTENQKKKVSKVKKDKIDNAEYLSTLNLSDSVTKKLEEAGISSKEEMEKVLKGEVKVAGIGEKTLATIKKEFNNE